MANPWLDGGGSLTTNLENTETTVIIANIDETDNLGKVIEPQSDLDIYTQYRVVNKYVNPQRRYMLGVTSPSGFTGQSAAFVQLAAQTLLWIADWTAMKTNHKPKIPDPTPADPDWVLLAKYYTPAMCIPSPANALIPVWRISGTYVYGKKSPSSEVLADTTYPRPPWVQDIAEWRNPELGQFEQFIIDVNPLFEGVEQA